ncbi:hypothetical protein BDK51DRAFT_34502 [Blyttiomyces helicus]|uniref:Uncharacterized protein n=1 Tax=Blyttiomyces helicus TaxID=388810 RepID=A0A4P9WAD6_9FUNG|nr:hypothetical protein BDK51DRAFT_34502 [Blyttiomyces helicus]|eukprot:RKO89172.1 hypothetical protein BDK51DRAFT_34502 [Blyttiomyces helicus]
MARVRYLDSSIKDKIRLQNAWRLSGGGQQLNGIEELMKGMNLGSLEEELRGELRNSAIPKTVFRYSAVNALIITAFTAAYVIYRRSRDLAKKSLHRWWDPPPT